MIFFFRRKRQSDIWYGPVASKMFIRASTATRFDEISYDEVLSRNLKVMDLTATALCKENGMPIYVFDMDCEGNLAKMLAGENIGTYIHP